MFKPMLAGKVDHLKDLKYPVYMSPKLDGIRAIVVNGVLVSRTLKPIPNHFTRARFSRPEFEGLDGELIVGDPTAPDCFNVTTSAVMRESGEPDAKFYVFDRVLDDEFLHRQIRIMEDLYLPLAIKSLPASAHAVLVPQTRVEDETAAIFYHMNGLTQGYEGSMVRSEAGPYKQGRSTEKEGYLLKFKPFADDEAVVTGYEEQMTNNNPKKTNLLGRTERSSCKENLVGAGQLGALLVTNTAGLQFSIGTGFSESERKTLWADRESLIGKTIRYRYQKEGMKDLPRFPSYGGFRND